MFDYIRDAYRTIKDYYNSYSYNSDPSRRVNKISAFFKAIFNYIFGKPKPIVLSNDERSNFERGLDKKLTSNYSIEYKANSITFKPKGLVKRL